MINISSKNKIKKINQYLGGFALPTVLIASMIMLVVLLAAVTATTATRLSFTTQYYNLLAKNASDAGYVYAKACLNNNNGVAQWSDVKPLYPSTDCSGNTITGLTCPGDAACSVVVNDNAVSEFEVGTPQVDSSGKAKKFSSIGSTKLLRSSTNAVWREYKQNSKYDADSLGNWSYKRKITVTNPGAALIDYQLLITPFNNSTIVSDGYRYETGFGGSWHMDKSGAEIGKDMSGRNNDGSITCTGTCWDAAGKFGGAYTSNGDDYITVPHSSTIWANSGVISLEAWVKTTDPLASIIAKASLTSPNPGYIMNIGGNQSNGQLAFWYGNGTSWAFSGKAINDGEWHYVAVTFDSNNVVFYIDDDTPVIVPKTGTVDLSSVIDMLIGHVYEGQIDEAKVYKRILSATEISNRYNSSVPNGVPKINHNYSDIRFTKADGTELPFWQESDGKYWVKYSGTLAASPTTTDIYMYYGNPSASSSSNGDYTFKFFDDFSSGSIDSSKWILCGNVISVVNKSLRVNSDGSWGVSTIQSKDSLGSDNFAVEYTQRTNSIGFWNSINMGIMTGASMADGYGFFPFNGYSGAYKFYLMQRSTSGWTTLQGDIGDWSLNTIYNYKTVNRGTEGTLYEFYQNDAKIGDTQTVSSSSTDRYLIIPRIWNEGGWVTGEQFFDNIRVRKYTSSGTEPTHIAPGAEVPL